MSLILDALNKADQEKEHQSEVPDLKAHHYGVDKAAGRDAIVIEKKHLLLALLVVLGLAVVVLLVLLLRDDPKPAGPAGNPTPTETAIAATPAEAPVAPVAAPETASRPAAKPSIRPAGKPAPAPEKPTESASAAADDSALFGRQMLTPLGEEISSSPVVDDEVAALYQTQVDETPQRIVTPTVAQAPSTNRPSVDREQAALLWREMNQPQPVQLPPGVEISKLPDTGAPAKTGAVAKADKAPKPPPGVSPDESVHGHTDVPFLHELPVGFQDTIPTLMYNRHDYAQGYVIINKKRHHEGETLADGVVLENLLADGVLLRFSDRVFKLGAESSWVNY